MEGYKHTELGWIPEDWTCCYLEDIVAKPIVYGIVQAGPHIEDGIPYIKSTDITGKEISPDDLQKTSFAIAANYKRSEVKPGDIVFSLRGNIGESKIVPLSLAIANLTQGTARISCNGTVNNLFLKYFLEAPHVQKKIHEVSKGSTFKEISLETLRKLPIAFPLLKIQCFIADSIFVWDKYIETLTQLLAAKQQLKKGLMQQLLTGKKRLPGFEEDWEDVLLKDVAEFRNGKAHENDIVDDGKFIVINSKFISTEGQEFKTTNACLEVLYFGEIVMVMSDIPNGKALAKCFIIEENNKYTLNQRICAIRSTRANPYFLYYLLNRNAYYLEFDSGVGQTNLRKDEVLECPLALPPKEEQDEMVKIFKPLDKEIYLLNSMLVNYKQQKQGLMQQLLTGKKRVNV
jgi:type I restriction enzyme, S subunit